MGLRERWDEDQRFRFLVVGAVNTAVGFALFPLLYLLLRGRVHYLVVVVIAHVFAVTIAFGLHRRFAFRATGAVLPQYLKFNAGYLAALAIGVFGMALFVEKLHVHPLIAQPILMTVTILLSYVWHSRVSFR
jgi:putative flippase GtrA